MRDALFCCRFVSVASFSKRHGIGAGAAAKILVHYNRGRDLFRRFGARLSRVAAVTLPGGLYSVFSGGFRGFVLPTLRRPSPHTDSHKSRCWRGRRCLGFSGGDRGSGAGRQFVSSEVLAFGGAHLGHGGVGLAVVVIGVPEEKSVAALV